MQIYVKTLSGKTVTIEIESYDTIQSLKMRLQKKTGVSCNEQILWFVGRSLEDDRTTLADYKIEKEASLSLDLRLRGGMFDSTSGRDAYNTVVSKDEEDKEIEETERSETESSSTHQDEDTTNQPGEQELKKKKSIFSKLKKPFSKKSNK